MPPVLTVYVSVSSWPSRVRVWPAATFIVWSSLTVKTSWPSPAGASAPQASSGGIAGPGTPEVHGVTALLP